MLPKKRRTVPKQHRRLLSLEQLEQGDTLKCKDISKLHIEMFVSFSKGSKDP